MGSYLRSTRNMKVTCCDFIDAIKGGVVLALISSAILTIYFSKKAYQQELCRIEHAINPYTSMHAEILDNKIKPHYDTNVTEKVEESTTTTEAPVTTTTVDEKDYS